jgi:hypothetical protein
MAASATRGTNSFRPMNYFGWQESHEKTYGCPVLQHIAYKLQYVDLLIAKMCSDWQPVILALLHTNGVSPTRNHLHSDAFYKYKPV